jgi:hypothetical protein
LKRATFHETPQRLGSQLFPAETRQAVSQAFQARFMETMPPPSQKIHRKPLG